MEAQPALHSTSTTYARPQQPTDSPAAALPTETLTQIFELSLHDLSPAARQTARLAFSQVCRHWYDLAAASSLVEMYVANSSQAQRLAASLKKPDKQKRVRTLFINIERKENTPVGRGKRLEALLQCCPKLERLHLTLADSLGERKINAPSGSLGNTLRHAIGKVTSIRHLELSGAIQVPATAFAETLSKLFNLRKLVCPTLVLQPSASASYLNLPRKLNRLEMAHDLAETVLRPQIQASKSYLTHIRLGELRSHAETIVQELIPLAPRLVGLQIVATTAPTLDYLVPLLQKLARVRTLEIGGCGYHLSKLFVMLKQLRTLEDFTLRLDSVFLLALALVGLCGLNADDAVSYIGQATKLKALTLQAALRHTSTWSTADLAGVEQAATSGRVELHYE